eukprot:6214374-Pleurochrysis_carterae.AAC.2
MRLLHRLSSVSRLNTQRSHVHLLRFRATPFRGKAQGYALGPKRRYPSNYTSLSRVCHDDRSRRA